MARMAAARGRRRTARICRSCTASPASSGLTEYELAWLPGYADSRPVRIGNAAYEQLQLDVYGELMDALHAARRFGLERQHAAWTLQHALIDHLRSIWREPDEGIWEVRGTAASFRPLEDDGVGRFRSRDPSAREYGLEGPVEHWRGVRDTIHADICRNGFDAERNTFVQYYGATTVDAALL